MLFSCGGTLLGAPRACQKSPLSARASGKAPWLNANTLTSQHVCRHRRCHRDDFLLPTRTSVFSYTTRLAAVLEKGILTSHFVWRSPVERLLNCFWPITNSSLARSIKFVDEYSVSFTLNSQRCSKVLPGCCDLTVLDTEKLRTADYGRIITHDWSV